MDTTELAFEDLLSLAREDPEALECYRQQQIDELIEQAPADQRLRLRGLQFQIDAQRQLHPNPLGACITLSQMMQRSFRQLQDTLQQLESEGSQHSAPSPPSSCASVLPFRRQDSPGKQPI